MNLLNRTPQMFTEEKAKEVAAILNADEDDDFTYIVVVAGKLQGLSLQRLKSMTKIANLQL